MHIEDKYHIEDRPEIVEAHRRALGPDALSANEQANENREQEQPEEPVHILPDSFAEPDIEILAAAIRDAANY